ncbi:MAG: sulfatase-like hydrolase/transferase [Coraliomargaritaceae bacterium]
MKSHASFFIALLAIITPYIHTSLFGNLTPNFVVIIADDQRWDAYDFMQSRMSELGRTARFPWLEGTTPNLNRLSNEGIHFDNAFTVFSTCSPSRATMLTGVYPHIHGVTDNSTAFPTDSTTYASLLKANGYTTGYFGKWHHGRQTERPGFDTVATFYGQGSYYDTPFYDGNNNLIRTTTGSEWVDDASTDYAINFIEQQNSAQNPFLLVLGFKTPHQPFDPPNRTETIYAGQSAIGVPNLNSPPPGQNIEVNSGNYASTLREYMRTIAGIDSCVGSILDKLEQLNIDENTAIIYISDNGFFRGEHKLGDKRAPYEESIRIPLMIRYPQEQSTPLIVNDIALNLDLAPTILDIAGLNIPQSMQGRSLLPLIKNQRPSNWRKFFFYQYNHDPEFPTAKVRPYIALRHENGLKLVTYEEDASWIEFFDTSTGNDPYEINNLINASNRSNELNYLKTLFRNEMRATEFLKTNGINIQPNLLQANMKLGKNYNFSLETSKDLDSWTEKNSIQGNGNFSNYIINPSSTSGNGFQISVTGNQNDYGIKDTNGGTTYRINNNELVVGALDHWEKVIGGDAVLIFEIPLEEPGFNLSNIELEFTARRRHNPGIPWSADLHLLGIYNSTTPYTSYSAYTQNNSNIHLINDAILGTSFPNADTTVTRESSALIPFIQQFYKTNPSYSGGQYLFLRFSPDADPNSQAYRFYIYSANSPNYKPKLRFQYDEFTDNPEKLFYRVKYGQN